jgi:hypothetical protein
MTSTLDHELNELRPPAGFTYDTEALRLQGVVEYQGGNAYTACKSLGVGAVWTPESGLAFWLDSSPDTDFTVHQMRDFHTALGRLLDDATLDHES